MITIEDIRNSARKSGFAHVDVLASSDNKRGKPWRAAKGSKKVAGDTWRGPRRATPEEAAQDYCDYVNGNKLTLPVQLKSAGHRGKKRPRIRRDAEVEAALSVLRDAREEAEGKQGHIYCISDGTAVKIGYSVCPEKRVAELQTGNPRVLKMIGYFEGTLEDEKALHTEFAEKNILQEWFRAEPALLQRFR